MKEAHMSLGKYISIIFRHGQIYINEKLKPYGISSSQTNFLIALYHHDGIRQEDLCHGINIDKGTTARAIKKLEDSGFVTRERDSRDKRAYRIHLTDKAREFKSVLQSIYFGWTDTLAEGMTESQKELSFELLHAMAKNATRQTHIIHKNKEQEKML